MQSFIKIDTTVLAVELPHTDTHTDAHTYTHTLIHTPSVSIATYSVKMTEYKKVIDHNHRKINRKFNVYHALPRVFQLYL